jgi:hypothetical protein
MTGVLQSMEIAEDERRVLRLEHNFRNFLDGDLQSLQNNEFLAGLISYLTDVHPDIGEEKDAVLERLGQAATVADRRIRERSHMVFSSAVQFFLKCEAQDKIFACQEMMSNWLLRENEMVSSFPVMTRRFEELFEWLIEHSFLDRAEHLARDLRTARNEQPEKGKALQSLIGKTLENMAKKATLERLADGFVSAGDTRDTGKNILLALGEPSARYLLNRLTQSYSRQERLALINLIPEFRSEALAPIEECIAKKPPWIIIRNLIYIVGEMGESDYYPLVENFLFHSDERVQHEIISCLLKISGNLEQERLLRALAIVNDRLKIVVIRLLLKKLAKGDEVLDALCGLAGRRHTFSVHSGFDLLIAVIGALKEFPSEKSIELLKAMEQDYRKIRASEEIVHKIEEALNVIEPQVRHSSRRLAGLEEVSFDSDPVLEQQAFEKVRVIEGRIRNILRSAGPEEAGLLIYNSALEAAEMRDFIVADMLRDRLLEVNPMAMAEVIELGERIEEEKNSSITSHHLAVWRELYDGLSTEEFNGLYYALRTENYSKDDVIVKSGETDPSLYFLNSGHVSLNCLAAGNEVFLKKMKPGDILGSEQFFSPSVWTVTLRALSDVQMQVLEYPDWLELLKEQPQLENTFQEYCNRFETVPMLLKMANDDRRELPRYRVDFICRNTFIDQYGARGRELTGELIDISEGGLAFILRILNRQNAKLLLGRQIVTSIVVDGNEIIRCTGLVVAVKAYNEPEQDYSIHVKLSRRLERSAFHNILTL